MTNHAALELLRRQRARASLVEYARSIDIPGAPVSEDPEAELFKPVETAVAHHHRVMLQEIQNCLERPFGRLMILAPPGSAKSTYASVVAPAWAMANNPGYRVITTSYASPMAERLSRRARAICRDPQHVNIWPDRPMLASDQKAVGDWQLSNGSGMVAGGILSGITGNRADALIIDDPFAGREEADSPAMQKKTMDAYKDDLCTRLKPKASVILINTRWSENDLSGQLLPDDYDGRTGMVRCKDGQDWYVLNIPAEAERPDDPLGRKPGEFLWPEWFPEQHWLNYKNDPRGQRTWNSLFQQRPTAADGIEFQRSWFKWYDPDLPRGFVPPAIGGGHRGLPERLNYYGGTDWSVKGDRSADFTEHGIAGMDEVGDLWFTDWWYGQKTTDVSIAYWIMMQRRTKCIRWWHEGGPIGHAILPAWRRAMNEAKPRVFVTLEAMPSIKNKAVKLASFQARVASGTVWMPLKRAWAERLVTQLCGFPAARYDDAADVCGLIGRGIDAMAEVRLPSAERKPQLVPFTEEWLMFEEKSEQRIRYT